MKCRLCSDLATEGDLCAEHAIAEQMTPEPDESVFCGACGRDYAGEDGWVLRTSRRGGLWVRCPGCVREWAQERRREETREKADMIREISTKEWRWIRNVFDGSFCALCEADIEVGEKCLYIPGVRVVACPSCWGRTRYEQGGGTRKSVNAA